MQSKKFIVFHLAILFVGAAFLIADSFYPAIWFDESYTVGLMKQDLFSMCQIASCDVHPLLYYLLLKLFTFFFGDSILGMRLFSALGGILLAALGYTHIRRDFGAGTGLWYSFLCLALPAMLKYASQIRMYTWAPFFVTLASIYAYRMTYSASARRKNTLLFLLFSIAASYTHYFAFFACIWINLLLLLYNRRHRLPLRGWLIPSAIQMVSYLPGMAILLKQIRIGGASWIHVAYPDTLIQTLNFFFIGDTAEDAVHMTEGSYLFFTLLSVGIWLSFLLLLLSRFHSRRKDAKPALLALVLFLGVIVFSLAVSLFRPIYYPRYTMTLYGIAVFFFADLAAEISRTGKVLYASVFLALSCLRAVPMYTVHYDASSSCVKDTLDGQIRNGDVFLMDDNNGSVITVQYPDVELYFYNKDGWKVDGSYLAFSHCVHILDSLDAIRSALTDYTGNIWVLKSGPLCELAASLPDTQKIQTYPIRMEYYNYNYDLILYQKGNTSPIDTAGQN